MLLSVHVKLSMPRQGHARCNCRYTSNTLNSKAKDGCSGKAPREPFLTSVSLTNLAPGSWAKQRRVDSVITHEIDRLNGISNVLDMDNVCIFHFAAVDSHVKTHVSMQGKHQPEPAAVLAMPQSGNGSDHDVYDNHPVSYIPTCYYHLCLQVNHSLIT